MRPSTWVLSVFLPLLGIGLLFYNNGAINRWIKGPAINVESNNNPIDNVWRIDISHHQKNVKWSKMADKKPDFIFLKATEWSTHTDTRYKKYKAEAEKLDIPTGAYHFFSYAISSIF